MSRRARVVMIVLPPLAAGVLGFAVQSIARSNGAPEIAAPAARAESSLVAGSGVVEPAGREVVIAAGAAGVVREVRVKPGDRVEAGDVLFALDDAVAAATVEHRRQDLIAAERRLGETVARLPQLRAEAEAARGAAEAAEADRDEAAEHARTGAALLGAAVPQREFARRRNALRGAESRLAEARARLDAAAAAARLVDPEENGATYMAETQAVAQARAALRLAETERDRLTIRSPKAAAVLAVNIRPGEFAAQGGATPPLILGALAPLHVRVDVDEADLPRLRLGAPAQAARRGAGEESIGLRFLRAEPLVTVKRSLTGGPDERVDTRVLQLVYEVGPAAAELRPGQLLDVTIGKEGPSSLASR